jgi:hypothetical protein
VTLVDSSVPPPPAPSRKLRPWYLVAAMVLTWFVGVHGLNLGFSYAAFLRAGTMPDPSTVGLHAGTVADVLEFAGLQALRAMLANGRVTFPLAVAGIILSGLLVVASGLAMGGRKGARSLALQALGANAILVIATFVLTPQMRAAYVDGVLRAVDTVTLPPPQREVLVSPGFLQWVWRVKLVVFDLGTLAVGALALTRARTKTYFDAVARATPGTEEP